MLEELTVRNYALIDNVTVHFRDGFNVLTGETGAGKSILIDALAFVLGEKGRVESIRQGEEEVEVSAVIRTVSTRELNQWITRHGIQPDDDTLVLRRVLRRNGRGNMSIQSVPVTRQVLVELANAVFDLHGQHQQQSLFRLDTHRILLDRFADIEDRVEAFSELFRNLVVKKRDMGAMVKEQTHISREMDFLDFAVREIGSARLEENEENDLEERQKILSFYQELKEHMSNFLDMSSAVSNGALYFLRLMRTELSTILNIDGSLRGLGERLESAFFEVEDIASEVRTKYELAEFDASELQRVEARMAQINTLQKKYNSLSVADLKKYEQEARHRLENMHITRDNCRALEEEIKTLQSRLVSESEHISAIRQQHIKLLEEKTEQHLESLGMPDAKFKVELNRPDSSKVRIGPFGKDNIEFLLSSNRGEKTRSLKSVASGGELSRVMLALKTVLVESDAVRTLIFDEVDTGTGGKVARSVGEHLREISRSKQVFCITHLATIAALADNHLLVEKCIEDGRTMTRVRAIDPKERQKEISRMLAGNREDKSSLEHAASLLGKE